MKNTLFLFIFLTSVAAAQQSRVQGVITVFRSKYETGKTEFVQNAAVNHASQNPKAQQQLTDGDGRFTLTFIEMNPGETVHLRAEKEDDNLEVVNSEALQAVADQQEPVKIWMCNRRKLARAQLEFQDNAATAAYKSLEKKEKAAHTEIERLKQNAAANEQQINALYQQIAQIGDQRKTVEKLAEDLAQKYARINLDDMPPLYNEAYTFFERGELDSALLVLNRSDLNKKTQEILRDREQTVQVEKSADELRKQAALLDQEAADRKAKNEAKTAEAMQEWRLKADVYSALFKWDSVEVCYRGLLALDSNNLENLEKFCVFLANQNKIQRAIQNYEKCLVRANTEERKAIIFNNLGFLYSTNQNPLEAEKMYLKALEIRQRLIQGNPAQFEPDLAWTLMNLGLFYAFNQSPVESEKMYLHALEIYERVAQNNPEFEEDMSRTLGNLGIFYHTNQNPVEAEKMYLRALRFYERTAKNNSAQFEPDLAKALMNLGLFYYDNQNLVEAEKMFLRALKIQERIAKNNPARFEPDFALTLFNMGNFYNTAGKSPAEVEKVYLRALEIYERAAKNNPVQFEPNLAMTLMALGGYKYLNHHSDEAEKILQRSLEIYERVVKNNPSQFEPVFANVLMNMGVFYDANQDSAEAEKMFRRSLEIHERTVKSNPAQFEPELASTLTNYGLFCEKQHRLEEARGLYSRALTIWQKEVFGGMTNVVEDLAEAYKNLGDLCDSFEVLHDYQSIVNIQLIRAASMDSLRNLDSIFTAQAVTDYGSLSWYSLFTHDFPASESAARRALTLDSTQTWVNTNLAHALLFQHKNAEAEKIYRLLKNDIYDEDTGKKYRDVFFEDLETLRAAGVATEQDIAQVKVWLE